MRRIELAPGQVFENKMLNRIGAFNADALVAATNIVEDVRTRGDGRCASTPPSSTVWKWSSSAFRRRPSTRPWRR